MRKTLTTLLCTALCISAFAGCGDKASDAGGQQSGTSVSDAGNASAPEEGSGGKNGNVTPVGEYPIVKEPVTMKIMGRKDPGAPDWGELEVFRRLTEITNIQFEFEMSENSVFAEQKNIALAGGEYPDMIWRDDSSAITDEETYGPQGVFLELSGLIEEYAPNIRAMLEANPDVKAAITSLDGKIYGLPYVFSTATTQGHLGFFDSRWMENVGIEKVPETTDELYEMLKAFKEQDANGNGDPDDEIPFTCVGLTSTMGDLLIPAFTGVPVGLGFNIKDDKVVYGPALPEYKEFLLYAHKLYEEGLLDPEFSTQTTQQWQAKVKSDLCGVYSMSPTGRDAETTTTKQLSLPPLTSPTNSEKVVKKPDYMFPGRAFITNKCENPEAAIRLLDMFYATEENAVEGFCGTTVFAGWEGEHWEYTDDTETAYQWIAPITGFGDINKTISVNMELPGYLNFHAMPVGSPLMENKVEQVREMQMPYYMSSPLPYVRFTTEESERGNVIENDLYSHVVMMTTKFITGEESIDNFDSYLQTLEQIGLSELTDIKEAALERWNEKLK